jgi:hypothetical protein
MRINRILASIPLVCSVWCLSGVGFASDTWAFVHVATFLCDDEQSAIGFSDRRAEREEDEMAADIVGRRYGKQVCGWYVGDATIDQERIVTSNGVLYQLMAFLFQEDHRRAWLAEPEFAPSRSHSSGEL